MDSMSITTGCIALSNAISKTSGGIRAFIREVRESRSELDVISGELHSLDGVLDLLRDDAASLPPTLAHRTPVLLDRCVAIVNELGGYISTINAGGLSRHDKKFRWIATRKHMAKLQGTLEVHKSSLGLALDVVGLRSAACNRKVSTPGKDEAPESLADDPDLKNDVNRVVGEMNRLTAKLVRDSQLNGAAAFSLHTYLDAVQAYGVSLGVKFEADDNDGHASSVGDGPDSAIEMNEEVAFPVIPDTIPRDVTLSVDEIDELLDELKDTVPSRPPTPPPKARARANSTRSSAPSPIDYRLNTPDSERSPGSRGGYMDIQPQVPGRSSSLRDASVCPSESDHRTAESVYTVVTRISSDNQSIVPVKETRAGRLFGHVRSALSNASEKTAAEPPPPIARHPPGLVRRGSRRLSFTMKSLPRWKGDGPAEEETPEPDTIFGVSLKKSMQIAKGTVKTRHNGSGSSARDFPLCVYKCYSFIKEEGVDAQDIFGEGGDPDALQKLKERFSTGPAYGEDMNWSEFGVYEAADLILLYLAQLPKPIISESVAKRWISLSKQATQPGSHAIRLEQCIDFWEEALGGVRGPARSLFKLLLNLWGDIADAADRNDMTAERLAARVLNPLMHLPVGKYGTDYMLGLAFLIRKRSEYSMLLQGDTRKSNAAF